MQILLHTYVRSYKCLPGLPIDRRKLLPPAYTLSKFALMTKRMSQSIKSLPQRPRFFPCPLAHCLPADFRDSQRSACQPLQQFKATCRYCELRFAPSFVSINNCHIFAARMSIMMMTCLKNVP